MTNKEMQRAMEFIVEMEAKSSAKIGALTKARKRARKKRTESEESWMQTEKRIRALLARTKIQERKIAAQSRKLLPLGQTATDRRLKALANLVERQIRARRSRKTVKGVDRTRSS
jgi:hypothetical protein